MRGAIGVIIAAATLEPTLIVLGRAGEPTLIRDLGAGVVCGASAAFKAGFVAFVSTTCSAPFAATLAVFAPSGLAALAAARPDFFGAPDFEAPDFGAPDFEAPDFGAPDFEAPGFAAACGATLPAFALARAPAFG
ncbi:MAG: hypothetical protein ACFCUN_11830 [Hyphomicrobiaceae bacterium]